MKANRFQQFYGKKMVHNTIVQLEKTLNPPQAVRDNLGKKYTPKKKRYYSDNVRAY